MGLVDMGYEGSPFTWVKRNGNNGIIQERLDRMLCNEQWMDLFPCSSVTHLALWGSDHRPILTTICQEIYTPSGAHSKPRFFFEMAWANEPECAKLCSSEQRRQLKRKKKELIQLEIINDEAAWKKYKWVEKELDILVYKDEKYWASRSKSSWLKVGDKNTSFFHKSVSARKKKNVIKGVSNGANSWVVDANAIEHEFVSYFDHLFTSDAPPINDLNRVFDLVLLKVSAVMNA
ncbi:uncharacterized protein LOC133784580 [Humulus lupulus]|uniref:uncharacterized protein LOC133784580 n=1 Tax=Humulus lupulus TaxID=3486 RepID=UPI002B414EA8|nr:uncharacterized protein LOC133784580 [Humulus lupulus]